MKPTDEAAFEESERYGFGPQVMKKIKVCRKCAQTNPAERYVCRSCGAALPIETLYRLYQRQHRLCPVCDTVLAEGMNFCPHCGEKQDRMEEDNS